MSLLWLYLAILLLFMGKANAGFGDESFRPSDVYIIIERAYACENTDSTADFYVDLRNVNDEGDKVVDIQFNLEDMQLTEKWKLNLVIDKWNNGDWDPEFYVIDGFACEQLQKYAATAWENLRKQIQPAIPEECFIESGQYKITDFTIKPTDLNLPITILGKYRVTSKVFDETSEEILCQVVEAEVRKK